MYLLTIRQFDWNAVGEHPEERRGMLANGDAIAKRQEGQRRKGVSKFLTRALAPSSTAEISYTAKAFHGFTPSYLFPTPLRSNSDWRCPFYSRIFDKLPTYFYHS